MAKKVDFKKILLEKGERIGLGAAGLLVVVLLAMYLFSPGSGLLGEDPEKHAKDLQSQASNVQSKLNSAEPTEADLPNKDKLNGPIKAFAFDRVTDSSNFEVGSLFAVNTSMDASRRMPKLLLPVEGKAQVVMTQLRSFIFNRDGSSVATLEVGKDFKGALLPGARKATQLAMLLQGGPGAGGSEGMGGVDLGSQVGFQEPQTGAMDPSTTQAEMKIRFVPIDQLQQNGAARLAETVRPLRQAIIVASFPYAAQIDEFKNELRLPSRASVLMEPSMERDRTTGQQLPAFRFLGVELQRQTVDGQGNPLPGSTWQKIELEKSFKPYVVLSGLRTEPSNLKLDAVSFDGLVMPRLLQIREGQYPELAMDLPKIKETLDALASNQVQQVKPKSPFNPDNFDIFKKTTPNFGTGTPGNPMSEPMTTFPGTQPQPYPTTTYPGSEGATGYPTTEIKPPDYCLLRVIDVTIRPGATYRYRLRVRMANPNYKRPDVASPRYAEDEELKPSEDSWLVLPNLVSVPPEMHYYAVDQKDIDGRDYKGMNASLNPSRGRQTVLQIHRWLENVASNARTFLPVGEWAVAERIFVSRGEYIGRKLRVEVPVWMETRESFVIPREKVGNRKENGLTVDFGHPNSESILVDFQGGDSLTYERQKGEGTSAEFVRDTARTEVLIFTSDGKLLAKNSAADTADSKRSDRLTAWRDRVKEVKEGKKLVDPSNPMGSPFGKGGGSPFSP